ncbi:MAG: hypothetical protein NTZ63_00980 [Candidatus Omnitrophica bacterium]|nr:hypothetical protein [Candidatus Omnitrophota bacterium]
MKNSKVIGLLLLTLAIFTIVGMVINNSVYWSIYNYATIIFSLLGGFVLLKQK